MSGGGGGAENSSQSIDQLRADFINLKNENKKLKNKKREIDETCERIRNNESEKMKEMTAIMYTKGREMQEL